MQKLKQSVYFVSLGCVRNLVDSEVMISLLQKGDFQIVSDPKKADIFVINTCGFLQKARQEVYEVADELVSENPKALLIFAGCMVSLYADALQKRYPQAHSLIGPGDIPSIVQAAQSSNRQHFISDAKSFLETPSYERTLTTLPHYAYVKIAEGCRKGCSYCVIPKIKGPLRSKPIADILLEIQTLLKKGVKEIILIAQDLADYGKDRKEKNALCHLLAEIVKLPQNFWLRLLYVYPDEITPELVTIMKSDPRICPYIDMPIQHVHDGILKKMRRYVTQKQILETIDMLRDKIPDIAIRTTLMTGFPTEGVKEFEEMARFLEKYPIDHVGFFAYSNEEFADSYNYAPQVEEKEKEKRVEILTQIQQSVAEKLNQKYLGRKIDAFIEGYHKESPYLMVARSQYQAPQVDPCIIINDTQKVKAFYEKYVISITDVAGLDLVGAPVRIVRER